MQECLAVSQHKTKATVCLDIIQMYDETNGGNVAKCKTSVLSKWITEKTICAKQWQVNKNWSIPEKKVKWEGVQHAYVVLSRKVGWDLLGVVEKDVTTRGLGVPVDKKTES